MLYLLFSKEFALTKKEDSDVKEQDKQESVEESDLDSEDLEVFYPTNQWQVVHQGKLNTADYLCIVLYLEKVQKKVAVHYRIVRGLQWLSWFSDRALFPSYTEMTGTEPGAFCRRNKCCTTEPQPIPKK